MKRTHAGCLVGLLSLVTIGSVQAELPCFTPLCRYFGFGWSDGYHVEKPNAWCCGPGASDPWIPPQGDYVDPTTVEQTEWFSMQAPVNARPPVHRMPQPYQHAVPRTAAIPMQPYVVRPQAPMVAPVIRPWQSGMQNPPVVVPQPRYSAVSIP